MSSQILKKIAELDNAFKNTPVVKVTLKIGNEVKQVYGKYEAVGFTGSAKDRLARYLVADAYRTGKIFPGDCIVETSSGNTGVALSALGAALGNKVKIFIPNWLSTERYKMLSLYGAEVLKVTESEGGFVECVKRTKELAKEKGYFAPNQFGNKMNIEAQFNTTIKELFSFLELEDVNPSVFVAGYGTGGVVLAAKRMVDTKKMSCSVHPLEPSTMPLISKGRLVKKAGESHKIEGIVDDFVPTLMSGESLNEPVVVDQDDAIRIAKQVNKMGVSFGISSGANLMGCIQKMQEKGASVSATVFCDGCGKYYSTELFSDSLGESKNELYNSIRLLDVELIKG